VVRKLLTQFELAVEQDWQKTACSSNAKRASVSLISASATA
jgi:hypothetical protein